MCLISSFAKMKSFLPFLLIFCSILFISVTNCVGEHVKKSVEDNRDDSADAQDDSIDQSMDVPSTGENETNNVTCTRRQNNQMHEVREAEHKQFPFVVAVMSDHDEFMCSGSVVSNGLILTTAHCTEQTISYVLLNATRAKKDETTVALRILKKDKFPTYGSTDSEKNVGLIYTPKFNSTIASKVKISNFTLAKSIVDFEAFGFGLNADVGAVKVMQNIGLENRAYPLLDERDYIRGYFDCVDTKVPTCFKDTGGPAIFDNELVGLVISGETDCIKEVSSLYTINREIAKILPSYTFKAWLDERIMKHEEQVPAGGGAAGGGAGGGAALPTFPAQASRRDIDTETVLAGNGNGLKSKMYNILGVIVLYFIDF